MRKPLLAAMAAHLSLAWFAPPLFAQVLHVNGRWDECAIVIDPSLTQEAWHQFVTEVGLVGYFRPLASARPLGARHFEFAVVSSSTLIDDADPAWNDTFSHPDATHWLFDGPALAIPGLMLRAGVTDRFDVGAYWTKSMGANYGLLGGQLQYAFLDDSAKRLAGAGRLSAIRLYGPDDMDVSVYGADVIVSKDVSRFSPYAGVGTYWSRGRETTSKVDLKDESVVGLQGMIGVEMRMWIVRLGAEFNVAKVPGYAFRVAFGT